MQEAKSPDACRRLVGGDYLCRIGGLQVNCVKQAGSMICVLFASMSIVVVVVVVVYRDNLCHLTVFNVLQRAANLSRVYIGIYQQASTCWPPASSGWGVG